MAECPTATAVGGDAGTERWRVTVALCVHLRVRADNREAAWHQALDDAAGLLARIQSGNPSPADRELFASGQVLVEGTEQDDDRFS